MGQHLVINIINEYDVCLPLNINVFIYLYTLLSNGTWIFNINWYIMKNIYTKKIYYQYPMDIPLPSGKQTARWCCIVVLVYQRVYGILKEWIQR